MPVFTTENIAMKLITINPLDGKGYITVAVQDNAFDDDRLEAFLRDVDELWLKKEYIEQNYAKVILAEQTPRNYGVKTMNKNTIEMQKSIIASAKKDCGYFKDADGEECYQFNNAELMGFASSVMTYLAEATFRETQCTASRRPMYKDTIREELLQLASDITHGV